MSEFDDPFKEVLERLELRNQTFRANLLINSFLRGLIERSDFEPSFEEGGFTPWGNWTVNYAGRPIGLVELKDVEGNLGLAFLPSPDLLDPKHNLSFIYDHYPEDKPGLTVALQNERFGAIAHYTDASLSEEIELSYTYQFETGFAPFLKNTCRFERVPTTVE